jgi:hypothetical protein
MNEGSSPPMSEQTKTKVAEGQEQAAEKLREQIDQRSTKAGETVAGTAGDLRSVGEELRKQGKDAPARYADRAAEQTERVGAYLKEADSERMLSDLEGFGRRQPLAVLVGGLAIGVAAARFLKASSHGRYQGRLRSGGAVRKLGTGERSADTAPRGVYAEGEGEGVARESDRQSPVPSGAGAGQ